MARLTGLAMALLAGLGAAWLPAAAMPTGDAAQAIRLAVAGALEQTHVTRLYDPSYVRLSYPGGDLAADRGVCADVIVRAFRKAGVDLQQRVHEDMRGHFAAYPRRWGALNPDPSIDHRRVANLMTYFARQGKSLPLDGAQEYRPGDVVAWDLGGGLLHIGIVSDIQASADGAYAMVHNIGRGAELEDVLRRWKIIGHYRYF